MAHIPVLLNEVIKFLEPKAGDTILDATIGEGGHAAAICEHIAPSGRLIGIDQDSRLLETAKLKLKDAKCEVILINGNFRDLDKLLEPFGIKTINAALFDLGMNSLQLEDSGRGFTFQKDESLLMNYKFPVEPGDLTAEEIVNTWPEKDIADIIFRYGEERFARRIAKKIVERRKRIFFKNTLELAEAVKESVPFRHYYRIHPATKTFQALRIAVNDELNALTEGIEKTWKFFIPGSRLAVISFHSLEDRLVKNFLRLKKEEGEVEIKTKKPCVPAAEEISLNPRSRSAKLRAAIKI